MVLEKDGFSFWLQNSALYQGELSSQQEELCQPKKSISMEKRAGRLMWRYFLERRPQLPGFSSLGVWVLRSPCGKSWEEGGAGGSQGSRPGRGVGKSSLQLSAAGAACAHVCISGQHRVVFTASLRRGWRHEGDHRSLQAERVRRM